MSVAVLGRLSRSASSVVAKAANGFHLLRIDGYSQTKMILPGHKISSQGFTVGDYSWRVDVYPNGRDTTAKTNSIAVYLQLTDHTQRHLEARYKFSLLDHDGNAAYELPAETGSFASVPEDGPYSPYNRVAGFRSAGPAAGEQQGPGCGHEEFIGREELERRREVLIRDDRLVLRCDVGVAQIDGSLLAGDELSEEEEEADDQYEGLGYGYGPPRRCWRPRRTDDDEYIKRCLTQQPGGSQGYRQGRARLSGQGGYYGGSMHALY